ncbi:MAG: hypothetical protein H6818_21535 [Phycisphaerales bacterium]|nr:hypothetical protein [Phycisphaerales bacterium]MCB9862373.1 hypothetical protein [Phycisphaerales bacterium]
MQPGESGKIPIKISTKKGAGPLSKSITVNTNITGADSTLHLTIKGEVWQPVQVTPPSAAFGRITSDQVTPDQQRKLTIINNIDGELKPTNVKSSSAAFKAELKPLEAGKKFELIVSMVPPLQEGNNTGKITIDTGLEEPATLEVPVYAFLTAPVDVTPTQLTLTSGRTAPMKRQFYIRSHDNKEFEVKNVQCTSDALKIEVTDMRGNKQTYQLIVDIPPDYAPAATGDQITFETSHPAQPKMTIPIMQKPDRGSPRVRSQLPPAAKPTGTFTGKSPQSQAKPVTIAPAEKKKADEMKPTDDSAKPHQDGPKKLTDN